MTAVWNVAQVTDRKYQPLMRNLDVDVAIIGGGVTGLSTAVRLVEEGRKVVVLESLRVGAGSTGNSTGNLYATLSRGLRDVRDKWDEDVIREVVAVRSAALNEVERRIERYSLDCQFARRPLYLALREPDAEQQQLLEAEYESSLIAGLSARIVQEVPGLRVPVRRALRIEQQAQYNPLRYAQELARVIAGQGGQLFEYTPVTDVDASEGTVTTKSAVVSASHIVFATHTPKGISLLQAEMEPSREYGVAAPLPGGSHPQGIFWLLDQFHSLRTYQHENETWLVVIGEQHATGHGEAGEDYYLRLEQYARSYFEIESFSHRWSAQQYRTADLLPYIGQSAHDNVYVGTGYAADGLTWGEVSAQIISNQIVGKEAAGRELFNPRRFTPVKSAKSWAELNVKVAKHLTSDYFNLAKLESLDQVPVGEGKVVKIDGDNVAVYRAPDNSLSVLSPVCPHMKCVVKWNAADLTWDCPCHGSRFATDGSVIEGPAYAPLKQLEGR
jgi:glycine/D-amino acid oxidase-like deaminating enzyme/nitrite reductase/ring-hydroxylating ferredoxin subunit